METSFYGASHKAYLENREPDEDEDPGDAHMNVQHLQNMGMDFCKALLSMNSPSFLDANFHVELKEMGLNRNLQHRYHLPPGMYKKKRNSEETTEVHNESRGIGYRVSTPCSSIKIKRNYIHRRIDAGITIKKGIDRLCQPLERNLPKMCSPIELPIPRMQHMRVVRIDQLHSDAEEDLSCRQAPGSINSLQLVEKSRPKSRMLQCDTFIASPQIGVARPHTAKGNGKPIL